MSVEIIDDSSTSKEQKNVDNNNLSALFAIPKEEVRIPSKGLVYAPSTSIFNSPTVEMRYMTTADEDLLQSPTLLRKGTWLTMILRNCIVSKLIDPEDLLAGDRNTLLFWLRQTAYGSDYELKVQCPSCKDYFQNVFQLKELRLNTLDVAPVEEGKNEFAFTLPTSKFTVKFSLLTGRMAHELEKEAEMASKDFADGNEKVVSRPLIKQITEIEGVTDKKEIKKFIETRMVASDSFALVKYIEQITPTIILKQEATCSKCGETNEFNIPMEMQFFWPQSKSL
jgi:phage FluMu protein Com